MFGEHEESRPFERECASYEPLPDAPQSVDQFAYWLAHKEQFPILSHLAKVVFAVTAASSKFERTRVCSPQLETPSRVPQLTCIWMSVGRRNARTQSNLTLAASGAFKSSRTPQKIHF